MSIRARCRPDLRAPVPARVLGPAAARRGYTGAMKPITNVVGFDDAPFTHAHRGDVRIVGAVCARTRLDGVLSGKVRRDGANATDALIELVAASQLSGRSCAPAPSEARARHGHGIRTLRPSC
jgi:hypothetical protein